MLWYNVVHYTAVNYTMLHYTTLWIDAPDDCLHAAMSFLPSTDDGMTSSHSLWEDSHTDKNTKSNKASKPFGGSNRPSQHGSA
jgi:hypothetical protein